MALLGPTAEIVKYGHFIDSKNLDAIAVTRIRTNSAGTRLLISNLAALRLTRTGWQRLLRVSNYITNDAGYIGIDYTEDSPSFNYELELANKRSDGTPGFVLTFTFLTRKLERDGLPIEVGWNPAVGRYQEFSPNGEGFLPELKNPPHRHVGK